MMEPTSLTNLLTAVGVGRLGKRLKTLSISIEALMLRYGNAEHVEGGLFYPLFAFSILFGISYRGEEPLGEAMPASREERKGSFGKFRIGYVVRTVTDRGSRRFR
jgi:hypothetical protein